MSDYVLHSVINDNNNNNNNNNNNSINRWNKISDSASLIENSPAFANNIASLQFILLL